MKCYIFAAAVYCETCGEKIRETLTKSGNAPKNPADENTYDSDDFPKGPYEVTASDYPQHCDCGIYCYDPTEINGKFYGKFLENPLTKDGETYVKESRETPLSTLWREHYKLD